MTQVGIRALKQNASAVVADAVAGEVVTITDRGRPVAQLTPFPTTRLQELVAAGRARPARRTAASLPEPSPVAAGHTFLSDALSADRDDERY